MEEGEELPFYLLKGMALVVLPYQFWGMYICSVFPCVVAFGVPFSLGEVLEAL